MAGKIFRDEEIVEEKEERLTRTEKAKRKLISMFQKITIIVYTIMMVAFCICVLGIIDARGGKLGAEFAFALLVIALMSIVVYTPKIVGAIADWIMALMKKFGKEERKHEIMFCIMFSFLPLLLLGVFVGFISLVYLII